MAWVLLATTGALTVLVVALGSALLRLRSRLARVELRVGAGVASSDASSRSTAPEILPDASLDENPTEYLITRIGEPEHDLVPEPASVTRLDGAAYGDLLAKETLIHVTSLAHGVRRALAPESRSRIRFHVRHEVKRARKQRRIEMRLAHREWAARQRTAAAAGTTDPAVAEPAA